MKSRKSYLLWFSLCLVLGITGLSAKDMVTKSGRKLKNYTIARRDGSSVVVNHDAGEERIPIAELPDDVARPYVESLITKEIAALKKENDLNTRINKLEKLRKQYPAAGNILEKELDLAREERRIRQEVDRMFSASGAGKKNARITSENNTRREGEEREEQRRREAQTALHMSQVWIHHPRAVNECMVYVFKCTNELEARLQGIADLHWKVNDLNDTYEKARNKAIEAKNLGLPDTAQDLLNSAQDLLNLSGKTREHANSSFQKLLVPEHLVGTSNYTRPGIHLSGVNNECIFFIIEVEEGGKYVHAWCHRAKIGDDLYIEGRNIRSAR